MNGVAQQQDLHLWSPRHSFEVKLVSGVQQPFPCSLFTNPKRSPEMLLCFIQGLLKEVADKQPKLDDVNQKAQALLETSSDARISQTITQLTTKYQQLLSRAKVRFCHWRF